jgi:hypothetical protein
MFEREKQLVKETAKVSIFAELRPALEAHATIEEEIFYPTVKKGPIGECERRSARGLREAQADKEFTRANLKYHARRRNLRRED